MDNTIIGALIGVGGTIIGVIGGVLLSKWVDRDATQKAVDLAFGKTEELLNKQEFLKAAAKFRDVFFDQLRLLDELQKDSPGYTLSVLQDKGTRIKHNLARLEFRGFLHDDIKISFDRAWIDFCGDGHPDGYRQYENTGQPEVEIRDLAIKNLDKLFEFAKP